MEFQLLRLELLLGIMNNSPLPISKYKCQRCGHYFEYAEPPGSVGGCEKCGNKYLTWINSKEFLNILWKTRKYFIDNGYK